MRIKQLSSEVANQIAAGEVIERPASVVKELLENSLDAGASNIQIDIEGGGFNRIKISDDGVGIAGDELPLAIAAHATSKIVCVDDLYAITSMGFRGEALASVASVSRLTISSKPVDQEYAMQLEIEGPHVHCLPCARSLGTTVDVCDLFFNTPVRKKFLKTEQVEYQAIDAIVRRFALSTFQIALTLRHNNKTMLVLPAAVCEKTRELRVRKLMGSPFIEQSIQIKVEHAGFKLEGWISAEQYQRSQNDRQWIYINRRMVKDKLIHHAVMQAYESLLHPGRYPACLLYLTVPAREMDVNVHPTKHEVRFQQPRLIHDLITSQISRALGVNSSKASYIEIREPYRPPNFATNLPDGGDRTQSWIILNASFAVMFLPVPVLVDLRNLAQHRLMRNLAQISLPLASRPLLVPIHYEADDSMLYALERYQVELTQWGVQLDLISDAQLILREIPQSLPQLDVQKLLQKLGKEPNMQATEWIRLLVACHSFDALQLSHEEQHGLYLYAKEGWCEIEEIKLGCLTLEERNCQDILKKCARYV